MSAPSEDDPPQPLVSVVITAYNCAQFVAHAIQSVLDQSWTNLELIVVDDGSKDDTGAVVKAFHDRRVRYIYQTNAGPNAARNHGIRESRGEFIAILDCDDWWQPEKIARQVCLALSRAEIGLVYSFAIRVDESGVEVDRFDRAAEGRVLDLLLLGNWIAASSVMISRRAVAKAGMFDESLQFSEDWEFWIRIAADFSVGCVREYDVVLLARPLSRGKDAHAMRADSVRFMHGTLRRYAPGRPLFRRAALAQLHYVASYNYWAVGLLWHARKELLWSLAYNPFYLTYYKRMVRLFVPKRVNTGDDASGASRADQGVK